jgi:hypothetical protein
MHDRQTEPAARHQDARDILDGAGIASMSCNDMKATTRSAHVSSSGIEVASASRMSIDGSISRAAATSVGRCINADDGMPEISQMPCQAALAASEIDGPLSGRRQQPGELVAMVTPIAVVTGRTGPFDPLLGFGFPALTEIHAISSTAATLFGR